MGPSRTANKRGRAIEKAIATWFGCGYSPVAPGTAGSIAAIALAYIARVVWGVGPQHFLLAGAVLVVPGIWAAGRLADATEKKDPGIVVVDEVVGQWITLAGATQLNWKSWLLAFVLFRTMDIIKPPPARQLESLRGGFGIIADDVMAGIYAALVLYLLGWCNFY